MRTAVDTVKLAISYIEMHLTGKLQIADVAAALHYSKYHLHHIFTEVTGMTMHDYIRRRQLTEAARMLIYSEWTLTEIAYKAGYDTQQAFASVFKAMYKLSPGRYRECGEFYPLQLAFEFGAYDTATGQRRLEIVSAQKSDIPEWMALVELVVDGYPCLNQEEYRKVLERYIGQKRSFILRDSGVAVGSMMLDYQRGSIDFLGVHPLWKKYRVQQKLVKRAMKELRNHKYIMTTTYRADDKADIGHRKILQDLGFREGVFLMEFGYPTQLFSVEVTESLHRTDCGV